MIPKLASPVHTKSQLTFDTVKFKALTKVTYHNWYSLLIHLFIPHAGQVLY